jgi:hypothetical protein
VVDWDHTQWVSSVLAWTVDIKPGTPQRDLLRVFSTEGGVSTRTHRTYVLKQCPYIKVDVEFAAVRERRTRRLSFGSESVHQSRPLSLVYQYWELFCFQRQLRGGSPVLSPFFSPRKQYLISELMPVTRSPSSTISLQARAERAGTPSP